MGCLNNIITNSKYYPYVFWFSTASAFLAVLLNLYLIQSYGIVGAAYATLMVIVLINILKLVLVQVKFRINPYGRETFITLGIIVLLYLLVSQWSINHHPFWSLAVRSLVIAFVFSVLSHFLKLTKDIRQFLIKTFSGSKKT
jgi:O-antigen/teichoic acid export membrane protein